MQNAHSAAVRSVRFTFRTFLAYKKVKQNNKMKRSHTHTHARTYIYTYIYICINIYIYMHAMAAIDADCAAGVAAESIKA